MMQKLRSVAQNEWKKRPYIFFLLLVKKKQVWAEKTGKKRKNSKKLKVACNYPNICILTEIIFLQEGQHVWLSGDPIVFNSYQSGQPDNLHMMVSSTGNIDLLQGADCIDLFNELLSGGETISYLNLEFILYSTK